MPEGPTIEAYAELMFALLFPYNSSPVSLIYPEELHSAKTQGSPVDIFTLCVRTSAPLFPSWIDLALQTG